MKKLINSQGQPGNHNIQNYNNNNENKNEINN
jgi:hypothetical protein